MKRVEKRNGGGCRKVGIRKRKVDEMKVEKAAKETKERLRIVRETERIMSLEERIGGG